MMRALLILTCFVATAALYSADWWKPKPPKKEAAKDCPAGQRSVLWGDDTHCVAKGCDKNQYVHGHVCHNCPEGKANLAGDDASGTDTTCFDTSSFEKQNHCFDGPSGTCYTCNYGANDDCANWKGKNFAGNYAGFQKFCKAWNANKGTFNGGPGPCLTNHCSEGGGTLQNGKCFTCNWGANDNCAGWKKHPRSYTGFMDYCAGWSKNGGTFHGGHGQCPSVIAAEKADGAYLSQAANRMTIAAIKWHESHPPTPPPTPSPDNDGTNMGVAVGMGMYRRLSPTEIETEAYYVHHPSGIDVGDTVTFGIGENSRTCRVSEIIAGDDVNLKVDRCKGPRLHSEKFMVSKHLAVVSENWTAHPAVCRHERLTCTSPIHAKNPNSYALMAILPKCSSESVADCYDANFCKFCFEHIEEYDVEHKLPLCSKLESSCLKDVPKFEGDFHKLWGARVPPRCQTRVPLGSLCPPTPAPTPVPGDYIYTEPWSVNDPPSKQGITNKGYAQFDKNNVELVKKMFNCWDPDTNKYDKSGTNCSHRVNDHHLDVERTFTNFATDYTRKMDKVQNGIEGLAQLHSTHDEMWHRICAIAERGAKYRMQEFKNSIAMFKTSMIDFKGTHQTMLDKKSKMEAAKVNMKIALQKWLTARKAHAAAHTRYVNFLHHLGLDFHDKNPAARYWREYSHGVTGGTRTNNTVAGQPGYQKHGTPGGGTTREGEKNPGGKVFGGWTPLQGPIPHLGQHSHKVFIDKLESIAQTSNRVGIFEDPKNPLHNYVYNATHGGREYLGNPDSSVVPPGIYGHATAGENRFQVKLMDKPFYDHMALSTNLLESEPTSMPSVNGLLDRSQQEKHNCNPDACGVCRGKVTNYEDCPEEKEMP